MLDGRKTSAMDQSDEDIDAMETSSETRRPPSSALVERNVRIHTAKMRPKDKKERHLKHDDCCRYCERYCDDKITEIKRREIEAWQHDVSEVMNLNEALQGHRRTRPKLRFMCHEPLGSPDAEPGFRRIKIPKELRNTTADTTGSKRKLQKKWNMAAQTEMLPLQLRDLSLDRQQNMTTGDSTKDSDNKSLGDVIKPPVVMKRTCSRDSLEASSHSEFDRSSEPTSQHSNRSCSNELLNVLTIDDAIKHHRDKLIKSNEIRVLDTNNKPFQSTDGPAAAMMAPVDRQNTDVKLNMPEQDTNVISMAHEFRLHPRSAQHSRPVSKTSITQTESTELNLGKTVSMISTRSLVQLLDNGAQKRPTNVIVKAVDNIVGDRHIYNEKVWQRQQNNHCKVITPKPVSERFRKMNRRLRELINEDYVFNSQLAARLQRYKLHGNALSEGCRRSAPTGNTGFHSQLAMSSKTPDRKHSYTGHKRLPQKNFKCLPSNSKSRQFLDILTDYRDSEVQVA